MNTDTRDIRIIIDTGGGIILLAATPENFAVAAAIANQPLYSTNGEWEESKLTYAPRTGGGRTLGIKVAEVRIVSADEHLEKRVRDADTARYKIMKELEDAIKAKADAEKEAGRLNAEMDRMRAEASKAYTEKSGT
jgi:hypothetical protein